MPNKISDQIVQPRTVLETVLKLQTGNTQPVLLHLEQTEPDLTNYLLETLTAIHHNLISLHASSARTRKVYRQIEIMALVCILSLQQSYSEFLQADIAANDSPSATDIPQQST